MFSFAIPTFRDLAFAAASCVVAFTIFLFIYRVTLHPYARYPGPILAKFSNLRGAYHAYVGDVHLDVERCHRKYGNFVRYGPNSLLVSSVDGYHDIYGNAKKVKKSATYVFHGPTNLLGIRNKVKYARMKKIFQPGFSDTSNRNHEPKVIRVIDTFLDKISESELNGKATGGWTSPKNMSLWCAYFTTDVISKVVFTTSWDLLTSTANHSLLESLKAIVRLIGVIHFAPVVALAEPMALLFLPHLAWSIKVVEDYGKAVTVSSKAARETDPSIQDVFGYFTTAKDPDTGELALSDKAVGANTINFIIAGSDTTASSLAAAFFYLSHNVAAYREVAQEIRSSFSSIEDIRAGPTLHNCVYLRAALNETLRMAPVATQPLWREVEEGGCIVDGHTLPAGCKVGAGIFSLHHNPKAFPNPYKFDVERWIIDPAKDEAEKERIKEMSKSFAPFSVGPRQCIAKNFALMEMLLVMANVFWLLDFEKVGTLGEGKKGAGEGREREDEFQLKSYFTSYMEGPMIRFKKREV